MGGGRLSSAGAGAETWTGKYGIRPGRDYGVGWMRAERDGRRLGEHGGAIDGFSAEVALLPEENLGFVMMTQKYWPNGCMTLATSCIASRIASLRTW